MAKKPFTFIPPRTEAAERLYHNDSITLPTLPKIHGEVRVSYNALKGTLMEDGRVVSIRKGMGTMGAA